MAVVEYCTFRWATAASEDDYANRCQFRENFRHLHQVVRNLRGEMPSFRRFRRVRWNGAAAHGHRADSDRESVPELVSGEQGWPAENMRHQALMNDA